MSRGINTHHDGTTDIWEFDGQIKLDQNANEEGLSITSAASTGAKYGLNINTTGGAQSVFINQDSNNIGINIDSEATSSDAINIDAVGTSGNVIDINLDPGSASTCCPLSIHAGTNLATGSSIIYVEQATNPCFTVHKNTSLSGSTAISLGTDTFRRWLWVDGTGDLRISATISPPTGDTSGSVVGTQS